MCYIIGGDIVRRDLMKHRAPDQEGVADDGLFPIGVGRLAIIDPDAENLCPYEEKGHILAFNGCIYNYIELREQLMSEGYVFTTKSDTEVLMKAYLEWGEDCMWHLEGMFAFAVYDGKKVFCARDIAGEKPLYFRRDPFAFASEAKALEWNCEELKPGHCLIYDGKKVKTRQWWHLRPYTPSDPIAELEELLEHSVKIRTRADVPYALYYSGGIDSTLLSTFHNFEHKFTYDDSLYSAEDFKRELPYIAWHLDYPVKSFSAFGLYKLAERARKHVKVVISGEGADELFGGYTRFIPNWLNYRARKHYPSYEKMFPYDPEMEWKEFNGNMRELLRMGDRMAAAWGLENRCPYLDKDIIRMAFNLNMEDKYEEFHGKQILRKLLKKRMPEYEFEEKHGLYCSVPTWLGSKDPMDKKIWVKAQEKYVRKNPYT